MQLLVEFEKIFFNALFIDKIRKDYRKLIQYSSYNEQI